MFKIFKIFEFFKYALKKRTRTGDNINLSLPKCKFNYTQNNILNKEVQLRNSINVDIRLTKNFRKFKSLVFHIFHKLSRFITLFNLLYLLRQRVLIAVMSVMSISVMNSVDNSS